MNSSAFKSLEPEKFHYTLLCVSPESWPKKTRRNKRDAHKMTKWKRQRMEEGEEEGEGERQSWGREGKGIWGTETNTYKTHKHSCLSEFVHKFSNLSCSLQGDGSPKAKGKGVVSWRSWSALDDTNVRRLYASFGLALYYYISTLSRPSLLRIAFVVCLYLHSKLVGYSIKHIYIYIYYGNLAYYALLRLVCNYYRNSFCIMQNIQRELTTVVKVLHFTA